MMQHLLALAAVSVILLMSSAFQIQSSATLMSHHRHRSQPTQQLLAAKPTNNDSDDDVPNTTNNPLHSRRNMLGRLATTNLAFLSAYASSANADVLPALDAQTVKERHVLILQRGMNLFKIYNRRVHRIKRPISG